MAAFGCPPRELNAERRGGVERTRKAAVHDVAGQGQAMRTATKTSPSRTMASQARTGNKRERSGKGPGAQWEGTLVEESDGPSSGTPPRPPAPTPRNRAETLPGGGPVSRTPRYPILRATVTAGEPVRPGA